MLGNLHAAQCLLLVWVQAISGLQFALEQPALGVLRNVGPWIQLVEAGACEVVFDWCHYGCDFRKSTRVLTNLEILKSLSCRCRHRSSHGVGDNLHTVDMQGHSEVFCKKVVRLCKALWHVAEDFGAGAAGEEDSAKMVRSLRARQKKSSTLWALQLSESLRWKTIMQYRFRCVTHINIQEAKARRSLVKRMPGFSRVVVCQDSRVNLGALGKGRSPSEALNAVMRTEAPYLLGKNLYLSGVHLPTWSIRADAPSRSAPVLEPRTPVPSWFWKLRSDSAEARKGLDDVQGLPRALNRWFLLGGALLLRASCHSASSAGSDSSCERAAGERENHREDSRHPREAHPGFGELASASDLRVYSGDAGKELHRRSVRMARRIYDFHVFSEQKPTGGCRDSECSGSKVWLAEILACRALERDSNMGRFGAGSAPPSNFCSDTACTCRYCAAVEMAAAGGSAGVGLFWIVETIRAYLSSPTGFIPPRGPPGGRGRLHPRGAPQDKESSSSQSTCQSGRGRGCSLGVSDDQFHSDVASHLEWLMGGLQTSVQPPAV